MIHLPAPPSDNQRRQLPALRNEFRQDRLAQLHHRWVDSLRAKDDRPALVGKRLAVSSW